MRPRRRIYNSVWQMEGWMEAHHVVQSPEGTLTEPSWVVVVDEGHSAGVSQRR